MLKKNGLNNIIWMEKLLPITGKAKSMVELQLLLRNEPLEANKLKNLQESFTSSVCFPLHPGFYILSAGFVKQIVPLLILCLQNGYC